MPDYLAGNDSKLVLVLIGVIHVVVDLVAA